MKREFRTNFLHSGTSLLILFTGVILSSDARSFPNVGFKEELLKKRIPSQFMTQHISEKMKRSDLGASKLRIRKFPEPEILASRTSNQVLTCEAGGNPPPQMHWLKDGERIIQNIEETVEKGSREGALGLSFTRSRLYLDCVQPKDSAVYTCVAENPFHRVTSDSKMKVLDGDNRMADEETSEGNSVSLCLAKKSFGSPARIYMWTHTRLEIIGSTAQLFCRSTGVPQPSTTWLDPDEKPIRKTDRVEVLKNGDLVISDLQWDDMGGYTCIAQNDQGSAKIETFLYPTSPNQK